MSIVYEKWRELGIDPFSIKYKNIKILKIISYPPAGNDVIECEILFNNRKVNAFIKYERSKMANFDTEFENLQKLSSMMLYDKIPKVYEFGNIKEKKYLVLEKIEGERLSDIFHVTNGKDEYLKKYGRELALIHNIPFSYFKTAKMRGINDYPKSSDYKNIDDFIKPYINYLKENKPVFNYDTFIHGDFHYANVLWLNGRVNGVIDFEYSGRGFKEQDIAWCCVKRPTQYFMDDVNDIKSFLQGYLEIGNFDRKKFYWCLVNAYCHFYLMNYRDERYLQKIKKLLIDSDCFK